MTIDMEGLHNSSVQLFKHKAAQSLLARNRQQIKAKSLEEIEQKKNLLWEKRAEKLLLKTSSFKSNMQLKAEKLFPVFVLRKSLRLSLCDAYLSVLWGNCSRRSVQDALKYFEENDFIKRLTSKPFFENGTFKQNRFLILLIPRQNLRYPPMTSSKIEYQLKRWRKAGVIITDAQHKRHIAATCCDLCGVEFNQLAHRRKHMDHCHETGHYRGSLCMVCNASAIGRLGDNLDEVITRITNYKEQFEGSL
jgi:hypothetical protein